jgi:hypothetical protein
MVTLFCFAQSRLEKRVNKKVMAMFEKAEDEYNDLMSKKNIIEVFLIYFNIFYLSCLNAQSILLLPRMTSLKSRK